MGDKKGNAAMFFKKRPKKGDINSGRKERRKERFRHLHRL